jgi:site-specific DNA recombinase
MGLIHIKRTAQTYPGAHEPLIPKSLFDRVQHIIHGRTNTASFRHDFLFRRRLNCAQCQYRLIGETHKGFIYYRCQTKDCPTTTVREEVVDSTVLDRFLDLSMADEERRYIDQTLSKMKAEDAQHQEDAVKALQLRLGQIDDRLNRLTDAYIDRLVENDVFEARKNALLMERTGAEENLKEWSGGKRSVTEELAYFLERAGGAYSAYKVGTVDEKRDLVDSLTSNRRLTGKTLEISLALPFHEVANRFENTNGAPRRDIPRTWALLLPRLLSLLSLREAASNASQVA